MKPVYMLSLVQPVSSPIAIHASCLIDYNVDQNPKQYDICRSPRNMPRFVSAYGASLATKFQRIWALWGRAGRLGDDRHLM